MNHQNFLNLLVARNARFSVFGDTVQGQWNPKEHDVVWIEDIDGASEITRYLLALGHRNIWYVANSRLTWFARRRQGYIHAMEEAGFESLIGDIDSNDEREVGFLAVRRILNQRNVPDAIFCGSDATAHGVYDALRKAGLRIPTDVSVAAFNDTPEAIMLHPPVTSVRVFPEQVGRALFRDGHLSYRRLHPATAGVHPRDAGGRARIVPTARVCRQQCSERECSQPNPAAMTLLRALMEYRNSMGKQIRVRKALCCGS